MLPVTDLALPSQRVERIEKLVTVLRQFEVVGLVQVDAFDTQSLQRLFEVEPQELG